MTNYEQPLYKAIAQTIDALHRCEKEPKKYGAMVIANHRENLRKLAEELPPGAGIDNGTKIDVEESTEKMLVLSCDYHHMNENGSYDGWTNHTIKVKPSLINTIDIHISGRNRNDIKDYLHDVFLFALMSPTK